MQILKKPISLSQLKKIAAGRFGNLVKAVVDVEKGIVAIDAELHADEEAALLGSGSNQNDLWGINLYPEKSGAEFIEFDSMINLRPTQENNTRSIDDPKVREKITAIITKLIQP